MHKKAKKHNKENIKENNKSQLQHVKSMHPTGWAA